MSDCLKKSISIAIFAVVAIIVFIFSNECIWTGDDISYQYICSEAGYFDPDREEIESLTDVIESQNIHYFTVNGRYFAHFLVQIFCGIFNHTAFAIVNSLMYIFLLLAIMNLLKIRMSDVGCVLTITILTMLAFDTKYVPSCQIGFIWMFVITLIWINIFFRVQKQRWWSCGLLFIYSVIVGNSQEALTIGIGGAVLIHMLVHCKEYKIAQWSMVVGLFLGLSILCFAPSTINRVNEADIPVKESIMAFVRYSWVIWLMIIIIAYLSIRHALSFKSFYYHNSFYIHATLLLLIMNFYIGIYGNRQLFGIYLMAVILIVKMLPNRRFVGWMFVLTITLCVTHYIDKWNVIQLNKRVYEQVVEEFDKSLDGIVYIDMEHNVKTCNPSPYMANRFFFDLEMLKYKLSKDSGWKKNAVVLPTCLKDLKEPVTDDQVVKFAEGCFVIIMSKNSNSHVMLKRYLDLGFRQIPLADSEIPRGELLSYYGDSYEVAIIYQDRPFIKYSSVELVK